MTDPKDARRRASSHSSRRLAGKPAGSVGASSVSSRRAAPLSGNPADVRAKSPKNKRSAKDGRKAIAKINAAADKRTASKQGQSKSVFSRMAAAFFGWFDTPLKRHNGLVVGGVLLLVVSLVGIDVVLSYGKIHSGVTVSGVPVGNMTKDEAAIVLEEALGQSVSGASVDLFVDDASLRSGIIDGTVSLENGVIEGSHSWQISSDMIGAYVDGSLLAEKAYGVGRGSDFIMGRFATRCFGVDVAGELVYDVTLLDSFKRLLTNAIGYPMENADIAFNDDTFEVVPGSDGYVISDTVFQERLDTAFLSENRAFVVPMVDEPMVIDADDAAATASIAQSVIAAPVMLFYEDDSWELTSSDLGSWMTTSIEGEGGASKLVARISPELVEVGIRQKIGSTDVIGVAPTDATFETNGDTIAVVAGVDGSGPDFEAAAADLNTILFTEQDAVREVTLSVTVREPDRTTADAEALGITTRIATYTTTFESATSARITNIHLISDLITNSLIAPGEVWSINETAGECDEEKGFQAAGAIVNGEIVDEIGGGICQVATTVFNAVYESGFPVIERTNHSQYIYSYPDGRDAAISWPSLDFKFQNDSDTWVLLTAEYTDDSVTISLWGTDPGYTVESELGEWSEGASYSTVKVDTDALYIGETETKVKGKNGSSIAITRYVYDAEGALIRSETFYSTYKPRNEVVEVGTKAVPEIVPTNPADESPVTLP